MSLEFSLYMIFYSLFHGGGEKFSIFKNSFSVGVHAGPLKRTLRLVRDAVLSVEQNAWIRTCAPFHTVLGPISTIAIKLVNFNERPIHF